MVLEHLIEFVKIFHLKSEVNLFSQSSLERLLVHWKIHSWRNERCQITHEKHEIHVTFNISIDIWVSYFNGYFFALVDSLVDLAHRP